MLPRFADIFQQGNRWLNWLEKQPEGSVRPVVTESVTKIMACGTTLMGYTQWCCSSPDCCHTKKVCFRCKRGPFGKGKFSHAKRIELNEWLHPGQLTH
ncbi:transposase zinc-binding domain protein [Escherichia coli P0299917.1]|nr:transposase zinc-binding domain protein [Escherichia coli MP021552.8]ENA04121.1 transposase zinc-binding domain protein [Escherichia coli P0299917.1]ENG81090.1 transposase zinc-binding domain protein [Escherichia coli 178850]